ncbi:hypothetical protein T09_4198 [Trichinella sp. T9]|nr:hypothetical protein T09_4198 [Trichinella sp. T9]
MSILSYVSTSEQDLGKSIICLKNQEYGANGFNSSTKGAPKLTSKNAVSTALTMGKTTNEKLSIASAIQLNKNDLHNLFSKYGKIIRIE